MGNNTCQGHCFYIFKWVWITRNTLGPSSSLLTSWLYSTKPLFVFHWHFMAFIGFSSFVPDYLSTSYIGLDFHQNITQVCSLFCTIKGNVSLECASLGYGVTPVRLQRAQVIDIVLNDIHFIRICQNGLGELWPLEKAHYCIVLGKHALKEFLSWHLWLCATSLPFSAFHYIYRLGVIRRMKWEMKCKMSPYALANKKWTGSFIHLGTVSTYWTPAVMEKMSNRTILSPGTHSPVGQVKRPNSS